LVPAPFMTEPKNWPRAQRSRRAVSSAGERRVDIAKVSGSIPLPPTTAWPSFAARPRRGPQAARLVLPSGLGQTGIACGPIDHWGRACGGHKRRGDQCSHQPQINNAFGRVWGRLKQRIRARGPPTVPSSRAHPPHLTPIAKPPMARWRGRRRPHDTDWKEPSEDPPSYQPKGWRGGETRHEPRKFIVVARSKQSEGQRWQQTVAKPRTDPHLFHHLTPAGSRRRSRVAL
jgi:hypothetical protein